MLDDITDQEIKRISDNTIILGDDADSFFKQELGQYILARARQEVKDCIHDLMEVDPTDMAKITGIKIKMLVAWSVPKWLNEAILSGKAELEGRMEKSEE